MSTIAVCPTADGDGTRGHLRNSGLTNQIPATMSTRSGSSLAVVTTSTSRAPILTPRTFTLASAAKSAAISTPRATAVLAAGQRTPTEPANALATDATAKVAIRKYRTPARKPTKGPNATST